MASVFLSYDRADAAKARLIALAFEKAGHSVWWDRHIKGGAQYSKEIEAALIAAEAIVVLWSERSVDSAWVRDEAAAGRDSGRLVPVKLDSTDPPMGFRQYQTIDLSGWKGRGKPAQLLTMFEAVEALGIDHGEVETHVAANVKRPSQYYAKPLAVLAAIALFILATLYFLKSWDRQSSVPIVAVAAAEPTASAHKLARDLLVKLGSLQNARSDAIQLAQIDSGTGTKADLIFEVGTTGGRGDPEANLSLLSGSDRGLLWSRNFKQPEGRQSDLEQQLAYTAARVLECAAEALAVDGKPLSQPTLKRYLSGCADLTLQAGPDNRGLISLFKRITEEAPAFEGAWGMLLITQAEAATDPASGSPAMRETLKKYISEARKWHPQLTEIYLAEAYLLPTAAIFERLQMFDEAIARNPEDAVALVSRADALLSVGRMRDAVADARGASRIDPLSPVKRDLLIGALTYSGQFDAAARELQEAEKLWPKASNLLAARYRLHLRYGDPREANRILQSGELTVLAQVNHDAFLKARIDPTPANVERAVNVAEANVRQYPEAIANYAQTMGTFGRNDELIAKLLAWRQMEAIQGLKEVLFRPALRDLHYDRKFMQIASRFGLLGYWLKSGKWPDFCFDPDLPYDCKTEAAKLR